MAGDLAYPDKLLVANQAAMAAATAAQDLEEGGGGGGGESDSVFDTSGAEVRFSTCLLHTAPLAMPLHWWYFLLDQFLAEYHGLYIVRHFDQIPLHPHNSSLEHATELKFAPFCSS